MIDYAATKQNCRFLNMAQVARECEVTPVLVYNLVNGKLKYKDGPKVQRIISFLREQNLLVEVADVQQEAA